MVPHFPPDDGIQGVQMQGVTTFVAAGAALLAATFSGLALLAAHNLENRRWARETLVETFVELLTLDFKATKAAKNRTLERSKDPREGRRVEVTREDLQSLHDSYLEYMTRLRLLVTAQTYEAVFRMHDVFDAYVSLATTGTTSDIDSQLQELAERSINARQHLIEQARRELQLPGKATDIWVPPSPGK